VTFNTIDFTTQIELCVGIIGDLPFLNRWILLLLTESIYESIALCRASAAFFSFLIYTQKVRLLGLGISPSQGRYLHTEQHKHRLNVNRYPCLEWDSNPRSQCSSGRPATVSGTLLTERTVQIQYWFKVRPYLIVRGRRSVTKYDKRAYDVSISGTHTACMDYCSYTRYSWTAFRVTKRPYLRRYYTFNNVPFNTYSLFINRMHASKHDSSNGWSLAASLFSSFRLSLLYV
jgi:hypothetical protein